MRNVSGKGGGSWRQGEEAEGAGSDFDDGEEYLLSDDEPEDDGAAEGEAEDGEGGDGDGRVRQGKYP